MPATGYRRVLQIIIEYLQPKLRPYPINDRQTLILNDRLSILLILIIVDISVSSRLAPVLGYSNAAPFESVNSDLGSVDFETTKNCGINWVLILKAIEPVDPFLYHTGV